MPMQWNNVDIDQLPSKAKSAAATALLAFNEPELPDQSNMNVHLAAQEWLRCIEPLRRAGVRCGSPGISSAPHAVAWLQDFTRLIRAGGGDVDFWCLHWVRSLRRCAGRPLCVLCAAVCADLLSQYGETLGQFYDYIWSTHHRLGPEKPVWITEFAATNWRMDAPLSREHVESFARESVKYLDSLDWVERYAWFGAMRDTGTVGRWARMLDDEGQLTPLGTEYRDG